MYGRALTLYHESPHNPNKKIMNPQILNRESTTPRKPTWQQIEATGEHPAMLGDQPILQVIDAQAIQSIATEFTAAKHQPHFDGLLVDADHLSHDPRQSTEAKAWLVDVEIRNGQLYGLLDWTDTGAEAVRGRRYKYFSTEYSAADLADLGPGPDGVRRVRPRRISGLSLTNRPNNRGGRPITNRQAPPAQHNPNPTQNQPHMQTIAEKLGLLPEATEQEILDAISTLQEQAAKAATMEAEAAADEILNRHAAKIPPATRAKWRAALIANRDATVALLDELPPLGPQQPDTAPLTNRATARHPDPSVATAGRPGPDEDPTRAARIANRAAELQHTLGIPYNRAFSRALAES